VAKQKITRRQWAVAVAGSAAPLAAQQRPQQQKPASPSRSERLREFDLKPSTEPAFTFKP